MGVKSVKRDSLSKQVSDQLEAMIENGEFQVGEKIPTETDLMDLFQVSRNTIREAIRALTWNGILVVRQGDGTYVQSSSRFRANMNKRYEQISLDDIREARKCIEVTIAHLAASRCTEEDLVKIKEKFEQRQSLKENVKENTLADLEFHKAIALGCHNIILIDLYESISDYLEDHIIERTLDETVDAEKIDALHEELYEAIANHQPSLAAIAAQNIVNI